MAWPLAGAGTIGSPFGADRDGGARKHMGNDIAAPKLTPVVAVADGLVMSITHEVGTDNCCWAAIQHSDGWQSYYIHLNNDVYGTDNGLGVGVRPDLVVGTPVLRGEVIGWVGDSGNAEDTVDHLHFELRNPEGVAVDPRPSLLAAQTAAVLLDPQPSWPYADDDGHPVESVAAMLLTQGILLDCDGSRINLCPDQVAGTDLARLLAVLLGGQEPPQVNEVEQPLPEPIIGYTETELARLAMWVSTDLLVTSLRSAAAPEDQPDVLLLSPAEAELRLHTIGARDTCNPPLDGVRLLTRAETVVRLVSWIRGINPEPCRPETQPAI